MSHGIYTSLAAGVRSFESLDLVANNLANQDTPGYRAQRAVFRVTSPEEAQGATGAPARLAERYLTMEEVGNDMRRGGLEQTGDPAHLALDGDGFLVLGGEDGARYTRDGSLTVREGVLVHQSGAPLLGVSGEPVRLEAGPFVISGDGVISQGGDERGRVQVVQFAEPAALVREGANLFSAGTQQAAADRETRVIQGALESSNVEPLRELVEMIRLNRFHEAYRKTLESIDEASRQLNTRVGRLTAN